MTNVQSPSPSQEVEGQVKTQGHYRVEIRPASYDAARVGDLYECEDIIRSTKVSLRGWDYPHLSNHREHKQFGPTGLTAWSDWEDHLEVWKFFRSGQFVHVFAFWENRESYQEELRRHSRPDLAQVSGFQGFLDTTNIVWTITEICTFLSRLAYQISREDDMLLTIGLENVHGYALGFSTGTRHMRRPYVAPTGEIKVSRELSFAAAVGNYRQTAQDMARDVLAQFGFRAEPSVVTSLQEELYQ